MMFIRYLCLTIVLTLLGACSGVPKLIAQGPTELRLTIRVAVGANPDDSERPSPVILNLYALKDATTFNNTEYLGLYRDPGTKLAADLLVRKRLPALAPGSEYAEQLSLDAAATQVGILAEFVHYQRARSMLTVPLRPHEKNTATVLVDADGLQLLAVE